MMHQRTRTIRYEQLYLALFSIYVIYNMFNGTMFYKFIPDIRRPLEIFAILLLVTNLLVNRKTSSVYLLWSGLIIVTITLITIFTSYGTLIITFCFIMAARNVKFDKIVRCFTYISISVLIITIISSQVGIVENLSWSYAFSSGVRRYAMGYVYPTDFVSCVFFTLCGVVYLERFRKFSIFFFLLCNVIAFLTYRVAYTRLDSACIVLLSFAYMTITLKKEGKALKKHTRIIYCSAIPLCCFAAILITYLFNPSSTFYYGLNVLLSNRLALGKQAITQYGFKLFGQDIFMKGYSARSFDVVGDYFYIDSSYLSIGLRYGLVLLFIICGLLVYLTYRQLKYNDIVIPTILVLIATNSLIAQHLFDGYTNVFLFAVLSKVSFEPIKHKKKRIKKRIRFRMDKGKNHARIRMN